VIECAGLRPLFLVGDDETLTAWLRQRVGKSCANSARSARGQRSSPRPRGCAATAFAARNLILSRFRPTVLARRLGIRHYRPPCSSPATWIEQ